MSSSFFGCLSVEGGVTITVKTHTFYVFSSILNVMPINAPPYLHFDVRHKLFFVLALCLLTVAPDSSFATELSANRFKLNGFLTVGALKSGTKNLGYRRDISGEGVFDGDWSLKPDTRLGLQLSGNVSEKLDATVQLILKDRTDNGFEESIEWAYLRYRLSPHTTIRAGRLGFEIFMLSDYRDLGFAYLWARPPIEFYAPIAFDYIDGIDIRYSATLGAGMLKTTLFAGSSDAPLDLEEVGDELLLNNMLGLAVSWELERWQVRFTVVSAELDDDIDKSLGLKVLTDKLSAASPFWPDASPLSAELNDNDEDIMYYSAGISYDYDSWFAQSEVMYLDSGHHVLKSYFSRYLSVGYRTGDATLFVTIAKGESSESRDSIPELPAALALVPGLSELQEGLQTFYNLNYIEQETASLGMRWDIRYDIALKLQWDRTWVEEFGGLLWAQKNGPSEEEAIDTYSINLNYIF